MSPRLPRSPERIKPPFLFTAVRAAPRWVGSFWVQQVKRVCQETAAFWKGAVSRGRALKTAAQTCFPVADLLYLGILRLAVPAPEILRSELLALTRRLAKEVERDFAWKCVIFAFCFRPKL